MKTATRNRIEILITWLMRIAVGLTFIFSGFVKAIDPWGTLYKFQDYMGAMGLPVFDNLLLVGVFSLCVYEFCVGIFLLTGCFRRSTPIAALLMMAVMLPLTLWIAFSDPVDDCGCFGDALVISNWATFWKNVVLTIAIIWLLKFNIRCRCLIRPFVQWIAMLGSIGFILMIGLIGYVYQPLIDFRPFKTDSSLLTGNFSDTPGKIENEENISDSQYNSDDQMEDTEESDMDDLRFIYAKDGVEKSFSIDDELPDEADGWIFVRREDGESKQKDNTLTSKNNDSFRIWSADGDSDITSDVIRKSGGQLLLLMPDLKNVSMAMTWRINSLYLWSRDNDIDMIGIVAGSKEEMENWKDISLASYPIYTAEDTQIKMLARGNPAVVYLRDGVIVWKSSLRALDKEDFQSSGALKEPSSYARDDRSILKNICGFYLLLIALLIFMSFLPSLGRFFPSGVRNRIEERDAIITEKESRREKINRDDKGDRVG